jgi:radical SAM protein with 4Fe4S-binding SPASM domain
MKPCNENLTKVVNSYEGCKTDAIIPPILVLEPTNNCNLDCIVCPRRELKKTGFMNYNLFKKIIAENKDYLKTILFYFRGESLLHPQFIDMLQYIKENSDTRLILSTNATILKDKITEKILQAQVDDIIFSIDGFSKRSYEKIRRGSNYSDVLTNVHNFILQKNILNSRINIILKLIKTDTNQHEIDDFIKYWRKYNCDVEISNYNTWANQLPSSLYSGIQGKYRDFREPCADLWFKGVITFDGKVVLCCYDFKEKIILGDLNHQSLFNIWNSERMKLLRDNHQKYLFNSLELCRDCSDWSRQKDEYCYFSEFRLKGFGGRP